MHFGVVSNRCVSDKMLMLLLLLLMPKDEGDGPHVVTKRYVLSFPKIVSKRQTTNNPFFSYEESSIIVRGVDDDTNNFSNTVYPHHTHTHTQTQTRSIEFPAASPPTHHPKLT
ncbi:hypothetical protein F4778DRAFT_752483 [Xylariomycetidae sp. FL2044]|nr:hypothetical protein F4778DRAFT_752483 [Xylariomycetidae sp. FL2044]